MDASAIEVDGHSRYARAAQSETFRRVAPLTVAGISVCVGLVYALTIPRGLAGDEVSHFLTVVYVAHHWAMPILGHKGVSYEAQFGPIYYFLAAVVWHVGNLISPTAAFYAVRMTGVFLFIPAVLLTYRLALAVMPDSFGIALSAAAFVGLDPSLLGNFSTVQNDLIAAVLIMWAIYLFDRWSSGDARMTPFHGLLLGLLVGVAVITKTTATFLLVALPLAALFRRSRVSVSSAFAFIVGVGLSAGWWVVRNIVLYHSPSPISALHRAGYAFPPTQITHPSAVARLGYTLFTVYWAPTESFGNVYHLSIIVRLIAALFTAAALVGLVRYVWLAKRSEVRPEIVHPVALTFGICYLVAIAAWLIETTVVISEQARTTLSVFFVIAIVLALGLQMILSSARFRSGIAAAVVIGLCLLAGNVVEIHQAHASTSASRSHLGESTVIQCSDPATATSELCAPQPN